ncbi:MAG TPA: PQQ-binding-like beta-propeller repeat protein [Acidimicrobiia bacterium]|nr:PQQ-binding-like beta-propeller repeat protein [Acidimicrobiia bacterium]
MSIDVAAAALPATPQQVISMATQLVAAGSLSESAAGYQLAEGTTVEVGPAMAAHFAGNLAEALQANGGDRLQIGRLLHKSGRFASAWNTLSEAALDPHLRLNDAQQMEVLEAAISSLDQAKLEGGETEGQVRLRLARLYRSRGQTADARGMLQLAAARLTGDDLIQTLGFAASVEDDLQHPQESERWVALAELVAAGAGSRARLGSLLTFHGRELSRLGFAAEAADTVTKGRALLEAHGSQNQRFYGHLNQAWIDFDQGQMRKSEVGFARLKEEAAALEGEASQATQEAYWARSLFGVGRPAEALEATERAKAKAHALGATAPLFIAHLAQAEGGILLEQWEEALDGAGDALDVAIHSMPSWENVPRYLKARALLGIGDRESAQREAEAALAVTPPGVNGLRWRVRIEELLLELSDTWNVSKAEDLTDVLLQSRWLGAAVDLMTARSTRENDPDLGAEAAALAMEIGSPIQAAKAVNAASLWSDPIALPVVAALQPLIGRFPEGWLPGFLDNPAAQAAFSQEIDITEEETALLRERIDHALSAAGLSGEMILSPAQRRSAGLVRRRRPRRRGPLQWIGAAVAMAAIAVVASLAVVNLTAPPPTTAPATTTSTVTTAVLTIENTQLEPPERLDGSRQFRGDDGRSGVTTGGVQTVEGFYWRWLPEGELPTGVTAISFGRYVYLPTDENTLHVLDQRTGVINHTIRTDAPIIATPAVGTTTSTEADPIVVVATDDGSVRGYNAIRDLPALWEFDAGEVRAAPLIVEDNVIVATTDGHLYALTLAGGDGIWSYPVETEATEEFRTAPAFHEGVVYLNSRQGLLHSVSAADGLSACPQPINLRGTVVGHPALSNGVIFVGLEVGGIPATAAGGCGAPAPGYELQYPTGQGLRLGFVATPDTLFVPISRNIFAIALEASLWDDVSGGIDPSPWTGVFEAADLISTAPVLADDVLYVGDLSGRVHAVDAATGDPLWGEGFNAGSAIRGEILVVPGAVFVTTASGEIIAIGGQ